MTTDCLVSEFDMQRVSTHGLQGTLALPLELSRTSIVDNYGCVARITLLEDSCRRSWTHLYLRTSGGPTIKVDTNNIT